MIFGEGLRKTYKEGDKVFKNKPVVFYYYDETCPKQSFSNLERLKTLLEGKEVQLTEEYSVRITKG